MTDDIDHTMVSRYSTLVSNNGRMGVSLNFWQRLYMFAGLAKNSSRDHFFRYGLGLHTPHNSTVQCPLGSCLSPLLFAQLEKGAASHREQHYLSPRKPT